ncbi:hypothetical protein BCON_0060g00460 [Botryotinia convoluta]|uniref:Uncharacterized protein n=1 Tax=Botryotinia convoluta TaxID=54673 RepID=A0A4Z1IEI2_9HELO|nr:hypothetical protein BCON_0060g00460 [Botryotinia convoluta]
MFSRLITYIRSITRGYRTLNRDDSNDVEKSTEETPLIVKAPASPNPSRDHSDDKSKGIGKAHPAVDISEHFDIDLSLRGHTNQSDTVFVDPAIKKQIDESYDTIDCTSETSSNASELFPSEQYLEVSTGFLRSVLKAGQSAAETLSKMENEQSNRLRYNSETCISTPSSNTSPRSLEAIQSSTNALEIEDKESNRAQRFSESFSATNSSSFLKVILGATMSAADTLAKKIENEKKQSNYSLEHQNGLQN